MASFIDNTGATQQLTITPQDYQRAAERNLTLRQMINVDHPTRAGDPDAWTQVCASEGMYVGRNSAYGIAPATMRAVIEGVPRLEAGVIVGWAHKPAATICEKHLGNGGLVATTFRLTEDLAGADPTATVLLDALIRHASGVSLNN